MRTLPLISLLLLCTLVSTQNNNNNSNSSDSPNPANTSVTNKLLQPLSKFKVSCRPQLISVDKNAQRIYTNCQLKSDILIVDLQTGLQLDVIVTGLTSPKIRKFLLTEDSSKLIVATMDNYLLFYQRNLMTDRFQLVKNTTVVHIMKLVDVQLISNQSILLVVGFGGAETWNMTTFSFTKPFTRHFFIFNIQRIPQKKQFLLVCYPQKVVVSNMYSMYFYEDGSMKELRSMIYYTGQEVLAMKTSRDGNFNLVPEKSFNKLVDGQFKEDIFRFPNPDAVLNWFDFTPSSQLLIMAYSKRLYLWNLDNLLVEQRYDDIKVAGFTLTCDGTMLLTSLTQESQIGVYKITQPKFFGSSCSPQPLPEGQIHYYQYMCAAIMLLCLVFHLFSVANPIIILQTFSLSGLNRRVEDFEFRSVMAGMLWSDYFFQNMPNYGRQTLAQFTGLDQIQWLSLAKYPLIILGVALLIELFNHIPQVPAPIRDQSQSSNRVITLYLKIRSFILNNKTRIKKLISKFTQFFEQTTIFPIVYLCTAMLAYLPTVSTYGLSVLVLSLFLTCLKYMVISNKYQKLMFLQTILLVPAITLLMVRLPDETNPALYLSLLFSLNAVIRIVWKWLQVTNQKHRLSKVEILYSILNGIFEVVAILSLGVEKGWLIFLGFGLLSLNNIWFVLWRWRVSKTLSQSNRLNESTQMLPYPSESQRPPTAVVQSNNQSIIQ